MAASFGLWAGFRAGDGKSKLPTDGCVPRRPGILLHHSDEGHAVRGGALAVGVGDSGSNDRGFRRDAAGGGFHTTRGLLFRHYYDGHAAPGCALAIGVGNALADNGGSNRSLTAVARIAARSWARSTSLSSIVSDTSMTA